MSILEQIADIGIMDAQYKSYGDDALLALAEFFEKGKYRNAVIDVDLNKATKYYEKYVNQNHDGDYDIQALPRCFLKFRTSQRP